MTLDRRDFFMPAGAGVTAAGLALSTADVSAQPTSEKDKLLRIAACSYPIRYIFKSRGPASPANQELKKQYGEITMLDFPQFTKDTFPGVTHMDIFSGLFGDVTDDSMFPPGADAGPAPFDPSTPPWTNCPDKLPPT